MNLHNTIASKVSYTQTLINKGSGIRCEGELFLERDTLQPGQLLTLFYSFPLILRELPPSPFHLLRLAIYV